MLGAALQSVRVAPALNGNLSHAAWRMWVRLLPALACFPLSSSAACPAASACLPTLALLLLPLSAARPTACACPQNVPPEKLFSRELAVSQLLAIIDRTTMADNGKYLDWAGEEIEW